MNLNVLELLRDNGVEVLSIPAYTSGMTQPCDVVLSSIFKDRLNECVQLDSLYG